MTRGFHVRDSDTYSTLGVTLIFVLALALTLLLRP
jgi:hypothetical protein